MTKSPIGVLCLFWAVLGVAGWYAGRTNDARATEHPHLWAASEGSGQQYDVLELRDRDGRFSGFDLEAQHVRFPDCTPPPLDADDDQVTRCLDAAGKSWELRR